MKDKYYIYRHFQPVCIGSSSKTKEKYENSFWMAGIMLETVWIIWNYIKESLLSGATISRATITKPKILWWPILLGVIENGVSFVILALFSVLELSRITMSYNRSGSGAPCRFSYPGFVMPKKDSPHAGAAIPPPSSGFKSSGSGLSKQGYSTMTAISQNALAAHSSWGAPKKRTKTEDEYFDEEEENTTKNSTLEYIPGNCASKYRVNFVWLRR